MKRKTTTPAKSESKSKIEPSTTKTPNSKVATSKKGKSPCVEKNRQTDEPSTTKTPNSKVATPKKRKSPCVKKNIQTDEPSTTKTPNSKVATPKKRKSPCVKNNRQTDEEYMASYIENLKREDEYSIELEARALIYEAEKKKHDIQEFKNRCESLDLLFSPSEGRLVDYYLRSKYLKEIDYCPIDEVDVNASHFQTLIEHLLRTPGKVGYCFTRCCLNEIHSATNTQGFRTFGEKEDVLNQGKKVGVKQVFEYCEDDHTTGFKIIEYQLDPAPTDQTAWFICKLLGGESCLVGQN